MFDNIQKIIIPKSIISETFNFLRCHGKHGKEAHAILAGLEQNKIFKITRTLFPKQNNDTYTYEVLDGEDHEINVQMYELKIVAIAQIHTHPTIAKLSRVIKFGICGSSTGCGSDPCVIKSYSKSCLILSI